jgi:D-alanine-D-alanine ligase
MTRENDAPMTVALLFGGLSSEHEISRVSAGTFADHMSEEKYRLLKVGITKTGRWISTQATSAEMADGSWESLPGNQPCILSPDRETHGLILFLPDGRTETQRVDVVIPAFHGLWGEDGTVQGLLKLAGIPFVGCDVLASAICMDKAVACTLFEAAGIPHCPWASYTEYQLKCDLDGCCEQLEYKLGYPMFVKPANAGSSVGISKALDRYTLRTAIEMALREDSKLIFEAAVDGQEVECAVLGSDPALATRPGEILAGAEFYTYDDKYKNGVSQVVIPARLSDEKLDEVRLLAAKAYTAVGCEGLARCDFFVEKSGGRVLINEINTFPGFTPISMYPKLMEHQGLPVNELIDELIALAMERADRAREKNHG